MKRIFFAFLVCVASGCYASAGGSSDVPDSETDPPVDPVPDRDIPSDFPEEIEPDCVPPQDIQIEFSLDLRVGEYVILEDCIVQSVVSEEEHHFIVQLDCVAENGTRILRALDIHSNRYFYPFLYEGEEVVLNYSEDTPWWIDRHFTIRGPSGYFILGGIDAASLYPWRIDEENYFDPIKLRAVENLCLPQEDGECYDTERIAVELTAEDQSVLIYDGNEGNVYVGDEIAGTLYVMQLDTAVMRRNMQCVDIPDSWFRALLFMIPGD